MLKCGALWSGKDKSGEPMLTGAFDTCLPLVGGMRIVILKNTKHKPEQPDYTFYLAEKPQRKEDNHATPF
jgi:hypothetical protein